MPTDARLAPEDRLRQVAAILAEGCLRLARGRRVPVEESPSGDAAAPEGSRETLRNSLAFPADSSTNGLAK